MTELTLPLGVTPFEFCDEIWHQKTRIVGLPDGGEIVLTQYRRTTDGRTDRVRERERERVDVGAAAAAASSAWMSASDSTGHL